MSMFKEGEEDDEKRGDEEPLVCVTMERECRHLMKRRGEKEHYEPKWVVECDLGVVYQEDCPLYEKEDSDAKKETGNKS